MTTSYSIQALHVERQAWVDELRRATDDELGSAGFHGTVKIAFCEATPPPDCPAVTVYLGSPEGVGDSSVNRLIQEALEESRVVIPVVEDIEHFYDMVPSLLLPINGFEWEPGGSRLARLLLEELGIEDRERKVFVSHRREDGKLAAEQLFDALSRRRFVPFLDRFCIRPGEPVQEKIADVLEEYSFLLLLETPNAHLSDWVFDEVSYALSHAMGVLIVRWPGEPTPVPGSDRLDRVELREADLDSTVPGETTLSVAAIDRLIGEVEKAHAYGLCRRRRLLMKTVQEAASAAGCTDYYPLPDWRARVSGGRDTTLVGVTPRLPRPRDLYALDRERASAHPHAKALLVHAARALAPELVELLEWTVGDRDLGIAPENNLGGTF